MPEVGKISEDDIYWGHGTFSRISRIDPTTQVTRTMVNARHMPYSGYVAASGVAGALDTLTQAISGVVTSAWLYNQEAISGVVASNWAYNQQAISGVVLSGLAAATSGIAAISGVVLSARSLLTSGLYGVSALDAQRVRIAKSGSTTMRMDAGNTVFSGMVRRSVSTALSTVSQVVAQLNMGVNFSTWLTFSGAATHVQTAASGHCIDFWALYQSQNLSSVLTSCGTSSQIKWIAVGT